MTITITMDDIIVLIKYGAVFTVGAVLGVFAFTAYVFGEWRR